MGSFKLKYQDSKWTALKSEKTFTKTGALWIEIVKNPNRMLACWHYIWQWRKPTTMTLWCWCVNQRYSHLFWFWSPCFKSYRRTKRYSEKGHKKNYIWIKKLPCGEKVIKIGIMKFRKKKRRGDIIKVYKALVLDNTLLQTNWELLFLLFLSLKKKILKNVPWISVVTHLKLK